MTRRGLALVLWIPAVSAAEPPVIAELLSDPFFESQAYLVHYGNRCLAVLPAHVAREAGEAAAFLQEGVSPLLGESLALTALGDDISVAEVAGGIAEDCGYSLLAISRSVDRHIRANAVAVLRSVNGDGSIA